MNTSEKNFKGHLAMLTANTIFGLNMPISKAVLNDQAMTSYSLMLYRMIGAACLFWIVSLFTKQERVPAKDLLLLFCASLFGVQINQMFFLMGLSLTSPVDASIVSTTVPIITMIIAALYLREPITWMKATGVLVGACGAILLIVGNSTTHGGASTNLSGNLFCLISATSFALYLTLFKKIICRYKPVTLMRWMFLFAAICCTPFCYQDITQVNYSALPLSIYLDIAYVVIGATFVAYLMIPIGQRFLRPTLVSMYNYVQPLVASLIALVVGMDTFGWDKMLAAGLVFGGVYIVTRSRSRADVEKESSESLPE